MSYMRLRFGRKASDAYYFGIDLGKSSSISFMPKFKTKSFPGRESFAIIEMRSMVDVKTKICRSIGSPYYLNDSILMLYKSGVNECKYIYAKIKLECPMCGMPVLICAEPYNKINNHTRLRGGIARSLDHAKNIYRNLTICLEHVPPPDISSRDFNLISSYGCLNKDDVRSRNEDRGDVFLIGDLNPVFANEISSLVYNNKPRWRMG